MCVLQARVHIKLGLNGIAHHVGDISIDSQTVANVTDFAGSMHILSMDQHFEDYVLNDVEIFTPFIVEPFPNFPLEPLVIKERSKDVIGNIGESIAGIVATEFLHLRPADVAHLQAIPGVKTPDYILHFGGTLPDPIATVINESPPTMPHWWPTESKASRNRRHTATAFRQLVSCWNQTRTTYPNGVGFGLIVDLKYALSMNNPSILITVLMPQEQHALVEYLQRERSEEERAALINNSYRDDNITGCLYGS